MPRSLRRRGVSDEDRAEARRARLRRRAVRRAYAAGRHAAGSEGQDRRPAEVPARHRARAAARQYAEALRCTRELLDGEPEMTDVWLQLGEVYSRRGMYRGSGRRLQGSDQAQSEGRCQPHRRRAQACCAAQAGRSSRSMRSWPSTPRPRGPTNFSRESRSRVVMQRRREAARRAQQADPTLPLLAFIDGVLLHEQQQFAAAVPRFAEARKAMEGRTVQVIDVNYYLADSLARLERYDEAEPSSAPSSPSRPHTCVRARAGDVVSRHRPERRSRTGDCRSAQHRRQPRGLRRRGAVVDDVRRARPRRSRPCRIQPAGAMSRRTLIVLGIVSLAAALAWNYSRDTKGVLSSSTAVTGRPTNVLLVTLDTMRADRLGAYGYAAAQTPNLDGLARRGARFDDAITTAPITVGARRDPDRGAAGALRGQGQRDDAAAAGRRDSGRVAVIARLRNRWLHRRLHPRPRLRLRAGVRYVSERVSRASTQGRRPTRREQATRRGRRFAGLQVWRPIVRSLAAVHLYDAHVDYTPPPPFAQDYDGEVAFVDQQVGRLLEALRSRGTLDKTLIVAVGDHGESLGEHGENEHGVFLYDAVLRVPLIVAGPGVKAAHVVPEQVRVTDVVPTILETLGMQAPQLMDGESVAKLLAGGARAAAPSGYAELYPEASLRVERAAHHPRRRLEGDRRAEPELYNLREDPKELNNRYSSQQALADRMIGEAARMDRELDRRARAGREPAGCRNRRAAAQSWLRWISRGAAERCAWSRPEGPHRAAAETQPERFSEATQAGSVKEHGVER